MHSSHRRPYSRPVPMASRLRAETTVTTPRQPQRWHAPATSAVEPVRCLPRVTASGLPVIRALPCPGIGRIRRSFMHDGISSTGGGGNHEGCNRANALGGAGDGALPRLARFRAVCSLSARCRLRSMTFVGTPGGIGWHRPRRSGSGPRPCPLPAALSGERERTWLVSNASVLRNPRCVNGIVGDAVGPRGADGGAWCVVSRGRISSCRLAMATSTRSEMVG